MNQVSEAAERYHEKLCTVIGCICCRMQKRAKSSADAYCTDNLPGKYMRVIPMCEKHAEERAQDFPAFEQKYGKQQELMDECNRILDRG